MSEQKMTPGASDAEGQETTGKSLPSIDSGSDVSRASQLPPAGPRPSTAELFVSGLLWASPEQALAACRTIDEEAFTELLRPIVAACFALAAEGYSGPELVLDYMRREGTFSDAVRRHLDALVVAGGTGHALPQLAAAVLADTFRERAEAYGRAIAEAAETEAEGDLWGTITTGGARLRKTWESLQTARRWAA